MKDVYILAIETSCDETSIAIVKNGHEVIAITILTQMKTHAEFGGVVPEIASRMHTENITMVLEETLNKAKMQVRYYINRGKRNNKCGRIKRPHIVIMRRRNELVF